MEERRGSKEGLNLPFAPPPVHLPQGREGRSVQRRRERGREEGERGHVFFCKKNHTPCISLWVCLDWGAWAKSVGRRSSNVMTPKKSKRASRFHEKTPKEGQTNADYCRRLFPSCKELRLRRRQASVHKMCHGVPWQRPIAMECHGGRTTEVWTSRV